MKNTLRKKSMGKEDLNCTTIRFQDRIARLEASPDDLERSQRELKKYMKPKSPKKRPLQAMSTQSDIVN
jgi:hypothetical protein